MSKERLRSLGALAGTTMLLSTLLGANAASATGGMVAPSLDSVQVAGTAVVLTFTDRSTTEQVFEVVRRGADGVYAEAPQGEFPSLDEAGTGRKITWADTAPTAAPQCYQVWASNISGTAMAGSAQVCTGSKQSVGAAPVVNSPTLAGGSATVTWIDKTLREDAFLVVRRNPDGQWATVADIATTDKAGAGGLRSWVDPTPNALKCYQVRAYDAPMSFEMAASADMCANGGLDPFDTQPRAPGQPAMAAASLDSVQVSGTSVTLTWSDRAVNEDVFEIRRRESSANWLALHGGSMTVVSSANSTGKSETGQQYTFTDTIPAGTRQCYVITDRTSDSSAVNHSNEMCTSALPASPVPNPVAGIITAHDTGVESGIESSLTIGSDGLGLVSYKVGGANGDLRVAHCTNTACTAVTTATIDSAGSVGDFSSVKIGGDGLGLISYVKQTDASGLAAEDLKVAHCVDVACTSATITVVDSAARVYDQTSLSIASDGLATIAYQAGTVGVQTKIKAAHCLNAACTSVKISNVDSVDGNAGIGGGPATVSTTTSSTGLQYLSYFDAGQHNDLKVATCSNADCSSSAAVTADNSDPGLANGGYSSITTGRDGLPVISYQAHATARDSDLAIAHCVNIYCTGITTKTVDTNGGLVGLHTSIAVGGDGFPVVGYYDKLHTNLKVAHCSDLVCSGATTVNADTRGDVGQQTSIAIGTDGLPLVSYLESTSKDLHVAHCGNVNCTGLSSPPGVKTVRVFNCAGTPSASDTRPMTFWVKDTTAGASFTEIADIGPNWTDTTCGPAGFDDIPFTYGTTVVDHIYLVRIVDWTAAGCADDPNGNCVKGEITVIGDPNGRVVETSAG